MDKYICLKPIWHRGDQKSYGPGAEITLRHLNGAEINKLVGLGIVKKVVRAPVRKSPSLKPVGTSKKSAPAKTRKKRAYKPRVVVKPKNIEGEE